MGSSDLKLLLIAGLIMKLLLSPLSSLPVSLLPSLATTTVIVVVTRVMVTGPGDSMARERLSPATMGIMVTREDTDTEQEDTDTTMARERRMLSLATMDITVTRAGDTDTGPENTDTTVARGRPS